MTEAKPKDILIINSGTDEPPVVLEFLPVEKNPEEQQLDRIEKKLDDLLARL